MNWTPSIKGFKNYLQLERSLSSNSIEAYLHDVEKFVQFLELKEIEISPEIDPVQLGKELQHFGRLQIKNFLTEDSAEMMHRWLLENKSWYLAYNDGDNFYESPMAEIQQAPAEQRQQMMNNIYQPKENTKYVRII